MTSIPDFATAGWPQINGDVGEGYGIFRYGDDTGIAPHIHIANIACGFHGGDPGIMARSVRLARDHGLTIAAHPSLPDRDGFGRRELKMDRSALRDCLLYQVGALHGFAKAEGQAIAYIKPHGMLYMMTARDEALSEAMCDVAELFGTGLFGLPGTLTQDVARRRGIPFLAEFFCDLQYQDDGRLIVTKEKAVDLAWLAVRLRRALLEGTIDTVGGQTLALPFQTVCIHNDMPNAADIARVARATLDAVKAGA